jgi:polyhydroxybutyrate depolymerase
MSRMIKSLFPVLLLITLVACGSSPATPVAIPPRDEQRTLVVGDLERTYLLHIPDGLNDQQSVPLVFVFHAYLENGQSMRFTSGLDKISDANGFITVYPEGTGAEGTRAWNASGCCGLAVTNNIDELTFVRAMIADVETLVGIDPKRIYAAGLSNGAMLSYRLACEMSDTFAAVAPVSGVLTYTPCQPSQHVSVLHVHGELDTLISYEGGGSIDANFPPVKEGLATWAQLNACSGEEQVEQDGVLTHTTYGGCPPGESVELYLIDGYGHGWLNSPNVPISQIIWNFFAAHPKP